MLKINKNYIYLTIWILSFILIGAIIGSITKSGVNNWYLTINKSPLTPPNYLFGVVWSLLYTMIAISGWAIWHSKYKKIQGLKTLYIVQLIFNWAWSPIFFTYHLTGFALIWIFLIIGIVFFIILKTYKKLKLVSLLFIPYFLWLSFAAYLNFYVWKYN